ncbi:MAG: cation diffusion facilitator family transporter [Gemmatimonadales bacterium]
MSHTHNHALPDFHRSFAIGVLLNAGFVVVEAGFGLISGSLALIADAGHNLSDVLGLVLAWIAGVAATRKPSKRYTYGFRRSTIIAALLNGLIILVALGVVAWEALNRFATPMEIPAGTVMIVAGAGVVVNVVTALMFLPGKDRDLNVRGAYLHMAADAGVSVGVVVAGGVIAVTGWMWFDPAVSLGIVAVVAYTTWRLLRESVDLMVDAVPAGIDRDAVVEFLASLNGVEEVHHLHIWAMSTTEVGLTAHLVRPGASLDDGFLDAASRTLSQRFGIAHATIQVESGEECASYGHM